MVIDVTLNEQSFAENGEEKLKALGVLLGVSAGLSRDDTKVTAAAATLVSDTDTAPAVDAVVTPQTVPGTNRAADPMPNTSVPTTTPTYTLAQLQGVIGPLLSAGKGPELQSLLAKYGVAQMTDLRADQMDLFAADLRAMGAQI